MLTSFFERTEKRYSYNEQAEASAKMDSILEAIKNKDRIAFSSLFSRKAVAEAKAGKIEYRLDKTNIIHCPIGKVSFGSEKLTENFNTLLGAIIKAKPAAAKGQYIKSCVVASTMGPGLKVNAAKIGD